MFEDATNYEFLEDTLKSSFTNTYNIEKKLVKRSKRINPEPNIDNENYKKLKVEISKDSGALENNKNSTRKPVERKFPGPAGLLPDNCDNFNLSVSEILQNNIEESQDQEILLCSQQQMSVFETGPWQMMVLDFQDSQRDLLYETFNIKWIKANFSEKKQLNYKAPFLACRIDKLELTDGKIPTVKIVLKDKTGTIQGTILYSLYDKYSNYFTVGSVLVLIQFGVLSAHKSHCLTITPNNLLSIYHLDIIESSNGSQDTKVRKIVLQQYSIENIWNKHQESHSYSYPHRKEISIKKVYKNFDDINKIKYNNSKINMKESIMNNLSHKNTYNNDLPITNVKITNQTFQNLDGYRNTRQEIPTPSRPSANISSDTNSRQISSTSENVHSEIWNDLFQGVDTDALFDDF